MLFCALCSDLRSMSSSDSLITVVTLGPLKGSDRFDKQGPYVGILITRQGPLDWITAEFFVLNLVQGAIL